MGCFALFWSLYYTLEVMLAHRNLGRLFCLSNRRGDYRAKRGRRGREMQDIALDAEVGSEDEERDSGVELQTVLEFEAKVPLFNGDRQTT